ncbi:MAG: MutS2/Smr-associated SH3 domain-containing protein, partial [Planctomycetota bacterium]
ELCSAAERIDHWLEHRAEALPALVALREDLPKLGSVRARIDQVIDARGRVKDDASPQLARLRTRVHQLEQSVESAFKKLLARSELKNILADFRVIRRGGRSTVAVKAKSSGRIPGIVHDRSQTEQTVFVEPQEVVEAQNRLAECHADERREIARLLLELSRDLEDSKPAFEQAASALGRLELAVLAASWAEENDARPPLFPGEVGAAKGLLLRQARHPLLLEEQRLERLETVVPIDLRLGDEFSLLILTGPNTGGKTLALKTTGLLALMTRCGLPVPCNQGTTIPLYEGIAADIGDEQEIAQSLSTFSSHLVRIKEGLERAGPKTLVLFDEMGGGTDPDEGAALGEAILTELLRKGAPAIVSTHLGRLKEFAFRNARAENACAEFDATTLRPLYKLLIGTPGESGALVIAKRLGLPEALIERAKSQLVRTDGELTQIMREVRDVRTDAERVRSEAESKLEDANTEAQRVRERAVEMERQSSLLEAEAQRDIEERVRDARAVLHDAQSLLDQLPKAAGELMGEALERIDAELSGASLSERRQTFLDSLHKGQYVYLPRYKKRVVIQKIDKKNRQVVVQVGKMPMRVSFDEVT